MQSDEPPFLPVGTEISAKFKGAFCEAKVKKVLKNVKCKVSFKDSQGGTAILDENTVKGAIRVGAIVDVTHPDSKQLVSAVVQSVKDCSTYTVVFDDGDERVLRRTQMCLKGGKHFSASESLDVMPLTKPEQFGAPVLGRGKGRRRRRPLGAAAAIADNASDSTSSSDDEEDTSRGDLDEVASENESKPSRASNYGGGGQSSDYGRVVCVYEKSFSTDPRRWFPALIVSPRMRKNLKINVTKEYLVRSFKDGRCLVVQKARVQDFNLSKGKKVELPTIKLAVEKAILYLEKDELPPHWDRELLLGERAAGDDDDAIIERLSSPGSDSSSDDEVASPSSTLNEDQWATTSGKREEGISTAADKRADRSESEESEEEAEDKSSESDSDDQQSPEVGGRLVKEREKNLSGGKPSRAFNPSHAGGFSRRSSSVAKRRPHQQQTRRRGGGAAMVSSERKDRFVAQLYKFMEERGTPINKAPVLAGKELDLYQFYDTVKKLGGYNRVCLKAEWKTVIKKMKLAGSTSAAVKNAYNRYLASFDSFYRKLGCALSDVNSPAGAGRISRRERHASKSSTKPSTATEEKPESTRRPKVPTTSSKEKESPPKTQKPTAATTSVSKSISSETLGGRISPKAPESREASKERSSSPLPPPPHPPIADEELVVGARVKVHYGHGNHRKLYQAKIVKIDQVENKYIVHYLGWNTRYDEAVPKSKIVEVVSAVTAASSDSGVSNNDQGENGMTNQKMPRSGSRSRLMDKSMWRRRRSSGGSTHSLPIGMSANDESLSGNSARKSSSISATQWRKTEATTAPKPDDEGDDSGKDGEALLSTFKTKPPAPQITLAVEVPAQSSSLKRPASANAGSESRERIGESSTIDTGPSSKRGRKAMNSGASAKRKKSLEESDEEEDAKNTSGNSRRVSKRLRGVKASIEEELQKHQEEEEEQSENEDEKVEATPTSNPATMVVETETDKTKISAVEAPILETREEEMDTEDTPQAVSTTVSQDDEEVGEDKDSVADDGKPDVVQSNLESVEMEAPPSKSETPVQESTSSKDNEKRKDPAASTAAATKARATKMRRRRRNYSQMVTDHRSRSTANKAAKRDADSDGEIGHPSSNGAGISGRHNDGVSPRDPNSLQALRHRIQAEMDADPGKFKSNYTFNVIDENLDSERKIQTMQTNIAELKETYLKIRAELSSWEKCRKKNLEKKRKQEKHANKPSSKRTSASVSTEGGKKPVDHSKDQESKSVAKAEDGGE